MEIKLLQNLTRIDARLNIMVLFLHGFAGLLCICAAERFLFHLRILMYIHTVMILSFVPSPHLYYFAKGIPLAIDDTG